jgi:hypothetical protein
VTLRARWVTLRARWVTLRARWVTLRARWVTLRARWVTLRARWVPFQVGASFAPMMDWEMDDDGDTSRRPQRHRKPSEPGGGALALGRSLRRATLQALPPLQAHPSGALPALVRTYGHVANRDFRVSGGSVQAVSRRPPIYLARIVARTHVYTYDKRFLDGPRSKAISIALPNIRNLFIAVQRDVFSELLSSSGGAAT